MERVILTTTGSVEGYNITDYKGPIFYEIVVPNGLFGAITSGTFTTIAALDKARRQAIRGLQEEALKNNANAVIGIDLDISDLNGQGVMVSANGTAVHISKIREPEKKTLLSKSKDFGRLVEDVNVDFSMSFTMDEEKMGYVLKVFNKTNKRIKAVSLNLKCITVFGEECYDNNLRFYFAETQFTGETYSANAHSSNVIMDLVYSCEDIEIEINKIVFGEDIVARNQERVLQVEQAKREKEDRDSRQAFFDAHFAMIKDCKTAKEMHALVTQAYPDGNCDGVMLDMNELQNVVTAELKLGNLKGSYLQKIKNSINT